MVRKILVTSIALIFTAAITACSGNSSKSFSEQPEKVPPPKNQQGQSTNNTGETASATGVATDGKENKDTGSTTGTTENTTSVYPPATQPSKPTSEAPAAPSSEPAAPSSEPAAPSSEPAVPSSEPAVPSSEPAVPSSASVTPSSEPAVPSSASVTPSSEPAAPSPEPGVPSSASVIPSSEPAETVPAEVTHIAFNSVAGSGRGNTAYSPEVLPEVAGKVIYTIGSDELRINATDTENKKLSALHYNESIFINADAIDPTKVQTLQVTDDTGKTVGSFQLVKQSQSEYMYFMPVIPRALSDSSFELFAGIQGYIATPTTDSAFNKLTGQATYSGKVVGYSSPLHVGDDTKYTTYATYDLLPARQPASADISLTVNFDNKTVTGQITNRFDHLAGRSYKWTDAKPGGDPDKEDFVTEKGLKLDSQPLILEATIEKDAGSNIWGFKGPTNGTEGVYVEVTEGKPETKSNVAGWSGIFAGDEAKEIVGSINSRGQMAFGATKDATH